MMNAKDVIRIGRNRCEAAWLAASARTHSSFEVCSGKFDDQNRILS
jgi:hypothetical protein